MKKTTKRVVIFDLDETLGCFVQLGIFIDVLEEYLNRKITENEFFEILDIFPEYLRPNIILILNFLKQKKQTRELYKVFLYTNNQGPKEWARKICKYLDYKINYKLFDQLIGSFNVEPMRTTHEKTLNDFLRTTNITGNIEICFIDDVYHQKMDTPNVMYINIDPYTKLYSIPVLCNRYYQKIGNINNKNHFCKFIYDRMIKYNLSDIPNNISNQIHYSNSVMLLDNLQNFLPSKNKTRKNYKKNKNNLTR
tara:strand:- start:641 stop:1393 length:753 start_codon:yes stop_codon:yes gene_type:complete